MRPASPTRRSARSRAPLQATTGVRDLPTQLFGGNPQHVLALLRAAWPAAVGPEVARRTLVLGLDGRTLKIRVPDAGWRRVLHRMRRDILSRLHRSVGGLAPATLGFQEAPFDTPADPAAAVSAPREPMAPLPESVREAAERIADPELRAQFTESAARYLGRTPCARR
jgi:hypothetical protein